MRKNHRLFGAVVFAPSGCNHRRCSLRFVLCVETPAAKDCKLRLQSLTADGGKSGQAALSAGLFGSSLVDLQETDLQHLLPSSPRRCHKRTPSRLIFHRFRWLRAALAKMAAWWFQKLESASKSLVVVGCDLAVKHGKSHSGGFLAFLQRRRTFRLAGMRRTLRRRRRAVGRNLPVRLRRRSAGSLIAMGWLRWCGQAQAC